MGDTIEHIAIVGMSGRFPGANSIAEFWNNLRDGVESIRFFSDEELVSAGVDPALLRAPGYVKAGALLDNVDRFDASFFDYSQREAELLDPQHRLFLECAWEALEDAAHHSANSECRVGVFGGSGFNSYLVSNVLFNSRLMETMGGFHIAIGNEKDYLTTRVSYKLNLKGPSFDVQTACSTSLVAAHLACQSLLNYQCDLALAGGVSISCLHTRGYIYQEGSILSPDGHCRPFDANAQGTIIGNGAGVVALRRLEDALDDGDHIYAVIRASAINNDGAAKIGYTAPSIDGQAEVIAEAMALASVDPETITYLEAHGTGTALGDPIEIAALKRAFGNQITRKQFCAIGSVKGNIGHLDISAGVAGLIKTALALKHKMIPPSVNFQSPNPKMDFADSPFYVNSTLLEWETGGAPRRAGVSSFGIGGSNAHAILEEAPSVRPSGPSRRWQIIALSAKTKTSLDVMTANLLDYLRRNPNVNLADVAHTYHMGRRFFAQRRALVCRDTAQAIETLDHPHASQLIDSTRELKERAVIMVFSPHIFDCVSVCRQFYAEEQKFREQLDKCSEILAPMLGIDLAGALCRSDKHAEPALETLRQNDFVQPLLFAIQYALAKMWTDWGVRPRAMIGQGVGEYVAACLSGRLPLEEALRLLIARTGELREDESGPTGIDNLMGEAESIRLEVGPRREPGLVKNLLRIDEPLRLSTLGQGEEDSAEQTAISLARLWLEGVVIDWKNYYAGQRRPRLSLPTYPFERQRCWVEPAQKNEVTASRSERSQKDPPRIISQAVASASAVEIVEAIEPALESQMSVSSSNGRDARLVVKRNKSEDGGPVTAAVLERIMLEQLDVMSQQLSALSRSSFTSTRVQDAATPLPIETNPAPARADHLRPQALGNVTRVTTAPDDQAQHLSANITEAESD